MLAHSIPVSAESLSVALAQVPAGPAVFALHFGENREPYLSHTADLRRRVRRILTPDGTLSRRLNLLPFVRALSWTPVGSPFESELVLYRASRDALGPAAARKRLRLRPPAFLRLSTTNAFPRLYATSRLARSSARATFGPFASRAAAERTMELVLDLFQLRRCHEDLEPYPEHPGCAYGEIRKCLAPCNLHCSAERYAEEATAVFAFFQSRGGSLLKQLEDERTAASEALEFERAAAVHARYEKVKAIASEIPEAVRLLPELAAVLVQPSTDVGHVSLFALRAGKLAGPAPFSTLGMRLHNEQSGSSSLFSHPMALAPVPLDTGVGVCVTPAVDTLETRLQAALQQLEPADPKASVQDLPEYEDALALFTRWCYRPHSRRVGEVVFADTATGAYPEKPLLRAISRVARAAQPVAMPQVEAHEAVR